MKHLLEFDSLYLEFGMKRVLHDIYARCETGQVTGILGRNGSGKSCLMKIVFGSMRAYNQSVRIDGKNISGTNILMGYISYLPQDPFIPRFLKVYEAFDHYEVDLYAFVREFPECEKIIRSRIAHLSGGEQRLVEVYLTLFSPSLFSILDEPFSYLMPIHTERIIQIMQQVKQQKGLIVTDHMYRHILAVSDNLYVLNNGSTRPVRTADELVRYGYLPV